MAPVLAGRAAFEMFWRAGFARTSLDVIAERAAVTKRTLYANFRSKADLLADVLQHYAALAQGRMEAIGAGWPADRVGLAEALFDGLSAWHAGKPRWSGLGFSRLAAELADMPGYPARAIAAGHKGWVENWYARRLRAAGVRRPGRKARELMLLVEGSMALALIHGDRRYFAAAAEAAKTQSPASGKKKKTTKKVQD